MIGSGGLCSFWLQIRYRKPFLLRGIIRPTKRVGEFDFEEGDSAPTRGLSTAQDYSHRVERALYTG